MTGPTSTHLFSGGCGDVRGFADAGFTPTLAANHDESAVQTLRDNFPGVRGLRCNINNLDFRSVPRTDILVGSPICTEISPAGRNATPKRPAALGDDDGAAADPEFSRTRATAWDLIRADEVNDFDMICGENVPDFFTRWRLFEAWVGVWTALGKTVQLASVNAAHISGVGNPGAPQLRNRIVFCISKKGLPAPDLRVRPDCICLNCGPVQGVQRWAPRFDRTGVRKVGSYGKQYHYVCPTPRCHLRVEPVVQSIREFVNVTPRGTRVADGRADRKVYTPYVPETRRKIQIGLDRFGAEPFIVILRRHCTVQSLDEPVSTITAEGNHHMLVHPGATVDECRVHMLDINTRAAAQRFAAGHRFAGVDTAQIRQIGNAVPVNVAHWLGERALASLTDRVPSALSPA